MKFATETQIVTAFAKLICINTTLSKVKSNGTFYLPLNSSQPSFDLQIVHSVKLYFVLCTTFHDYSEQIHQQDLTNVKAIQITQQIRYNL